MTKGLVFKDSRIQKGEHSYYKAGKDYINYNKDIFKEKENFRRKLESQKVEKLTGRGFLSPGAFFDSMCLWGNEWDQSEILQTGEKASKLLSDSTELI